MSRSIQFHNHPFRFLLYLEWALLAIAISSLLTPGPPIPVDPRRFDLPVAQFPILSLICIFSFGILGLWLPTGNGGSV